MSDAPRTKGHGLCVVRNCSRRTEKIWKDAFRDKCPRHRSREFKAKYPLKYYFNIARQRAKARKIPFELSYEQYAKLVTDAGWDESKRGRTAMDYSLDRTKNHIGYVAGNVTVMSIGENASKADHDTSWMRHLGSYAGQQFTKFEEDEQLPDNKCDEPSATNWDTAGAGDARPAEDDGNCPF